MAPEVEITPRASACARTVARWSDRLSSLPPRKIHGVVVALRVIRGARECGLRTVAVYSEADRNAAHVLLADEAVCIGESEAKKSYLVAEKILGFLAERRA